jgi:hypothetical protein
MHKPAYGFQFGEAAVERNSRNCIGDFFRAYEILAYFWFQEGKLEVSAVCREEARVQAQR